MSICLIVSGKIVYCVEINALNVTVFIVVSLILNIIANMIANRIRGGV